MTYRMLHGLATLLGLGGFVTIAGYGVFFSFCRCGDGNYQFLPGTLLGLGVLAVATAIACAGTLVRNQQQQIANLEQRIAELEALEMPEADTRFKAAP
jgi:hypothetical protein